MFADVFSQEVIDETLDILVNEIPFALWETFYVTILATLFAVIIGLPLGVLIVVGEKDGVLPGGLNLSRKASLLFALFK